MPLPPLNQNKITGGHPDTFLNKSLNATKIILSKTSVIISLIVLSLVIGGINPRFFTIGNMVNILHQISYTTIAAIGQTFVIISGGGGIDISAGSLISLGDIIYSQFYNYGLSVSLSILIAIGAGAIVGLINGLLITRLKIPPFIATLATMTLIRGMLPLITGGFGVIVTRDIVSFQYLGRGIFLGIPLTVIITVLVVSISWYMLSRTKFGVHLFAIGGNEEATRLAGISVKSFRIIAYVISGICASFAGVIIASRLSSGQHTVGTEMLLPIIAACVIGGASLSGGRGSAWGTFIGAAILGVLANGMNLLSVPWYYQLLVQGIVVALVVLIDRGRS